MERFVDRDVELDQLTDCYESETADFIVIYGRRLLGKSEPVRQSIDYLDEQDWLEPFLPTLSPQNRPTRIEAGYSITR
ncbi:MAG: ATP-binding protein [archaeon]